MTRAVATAALLYAVVFGWTQTYRRSLRPPTSHWQVPSTWVRERGLAGQALIWGLFLGPGLLTRNPFGAMWLIPVLLALGTGVENGLIVGSAVGAAHGIARACGLILSIQTFQDCSHPAALALNDLQFRRIDGLLLFFGVGMLFTWL